MLDKKKWLCSCGAALGAISWNGEKVPQLLLYRHAVDLEAESPEEVDVLGPLMGRMPVRCDACGEVTVWWPSAQVMLALLDVLNVKQLTEFVEAFMGRWNERLGVAPPAAVAAPSPNAKSAFREGRLENDKPPG